MSGRRGRQRPVRAASSPEGEAGQACDTLSDGHNGDAMDGFRVGLSLCFEEEGQKRQMADRWTCVVGSISRRTHKAGVDEESSSAEARECIRLSGSSRGGGPWDEKVLERRRRSKPSGPPTPSSVFSLSPKVCCC